MTIASVRYAECHGDDCLIGGGPERLHRQKQLLYGGDIMRCILLRCSVLVDTIIAKAFRVVVPLLLIWISPPRLETNAFRSQVFAIPDAISTLFTGHIPELEPSQDIACFERGEVSGNKFHRPIEEADERT